VTVAMSRPTVMMAVVLLRMVSPGTS